MVERDGINGRDLPGKPTQQDHLDLERPNAARIYDYLLGGSSNVAVDREAAEELKKTSSEMVAMARVNRSYLGRVVRHLAGLGVDQFLDLGSGIPTAGNVHEVAQQVNPQARVAYVDMEPVAVTYARDLLANEPLVTVTQADIRDPEAVLSAPGVAELLDRNKPTVVLAIAILHAVSDGDDPKGFLARYGEAFGAGSYLAITHLSPLTLDDQQVRRIEAVYERTPTPVVFRSPEEIANLLRPYELIDPGLVLAPQWHSASPVSDEEARASNIFGAVARLS
ncbi:MAG: SAM-dependent methyltransferase [Actinocatenispora sp.]